MVIEIINKIKEYCNNKKINLGAPEGNSYFQIMEINGYDYGNLSINLVVKLINSLLLKEVNSNGKEGILKEIRKNV